MGDKRVIGPSLALFGKIEKELMNLVFTGNDA
jgi:hypothetical protein